MPHGDARNVHSYRGGNLARSCSDTVTSWQQVGYWSDLTSQCVGASYNIDRDLYGKLWVIRNPTHHLIFIHRIDMTRKELEDLLIERVGRNYWQYPETSMWYIKTLKYLEQRKKKEVDVV